MRGRRQAAGKNDVNGRLVAKRRGCGGGAVCVVPYISEAGRRKTEWGSLENEKNVFKIYTKPEVSAIHTEHGRQLCQRVR